MIDFNKTPIAWLQLRYQKAQTIAAILGIAFISVLLFMQIGFRTAFLSTLTDLPARLNGDLFMINSSTLTVLRSPEFSARRLYQTLSDHRVTAVTPVYTSAVAMPDPRGRPKYLQKIQVIGLPLARDVIDIAEVNQQKDKLRRSGVYLIDAASRPEYRSVIEQLATEPYQTEIRTGAGQKRIFVDGAFHLGANTTNDAHLITSDTSFMQAFNRNRNSINIGLLHLAAGADARQVSESLSDYLPDDVWVMTKQELLDKEQYFYEFQTPIGMIFRFGLAGAVIVGIVILYQILFQLITKYLRDYATLKAIGFSHGMLKTIVIKEGLILALLGFLPGFLLSVLMYQFLSDATAMKVEMTWQVAVMVFSAICFICFISALLAIRKLREADPADLFG